MKSLIPMAAIVLCIAGAACAQYPTTWSVTPTVGTPTWTRENPGAASMTHFYRFGGRTNNAGGVATNALWEFDGMTWTQRTAEGAPGSPPQRHQAAVCWDYGRDVLVVFGGYDISNTVLNDTWEWSPATNLWTQVVGTSPSARRFVAMAWDPSGMSGDIIMFGGLDGGGTHLNDTWAYQGGSGWVQLNPANVPSVRRQHSMMTRLDFGDILMCAGQDASQPAPAKWRTDVWTWGGTDWTLIPTVNTPAAVVANQAVYDLTRMKVVMTGGNGINGGSPTSQISEFDTLTNDWTVYGYATPGTPDPVIGRVSRYFAAYLPTTGKIYKVGGQNPSGTGAAPPTTCEYGIGYPGSGADLEVGLSVNGGPSALAAVHFVGSADTFTMITSSPGGSLDGQPMILAATLFPTGVPPVGTSSTGTGPIDLWIDLTNFILLLDGVTGMGIPAVVLPGGTPFGPIPSTPTIVGFSGMVQAAAVTTGPAPTLVLGDALEIRFVN